MRSKTRLVVLAAVLTQLAACSSVPNAVNPIAWYRGITGASKNDDLGKGENEANLKEGSNEPYPNLASVPDAPETALSTVDRGKLVDSLIADRNNAKYASDGLRAGSSSVGGAPPPPPPAPAPATSKTAAGAAPASPQPSAAPASPPASSTAAAATPQKAQSPEKLAQAKAPARGSETPPPESSLQSPKIDNPPQGEAVTPAPPPPRIPPPSAAAKAPAQTQSTAATPQTDTVMAAPPAPQIPPPAHAAAPSPEKLASAAAAASESSEHHGVSRHIADVTFPPGSALLSDKLRDKIDSIVKQHNEDGGRIRIVGHGEAVGANAAVAGFNLALDRAQAVAVALSDSGVPSKDISVEAAPVPASGGRDVPRAEVFFEN